MACFTPPPPPPPLRSLKEISTVTSDCFTLACYGVFSVLIGLDVWKAYDKRATWLPGKAFALSGVTVQIIVWWTSLSNILSGYEGDASNLSYYHQIIVGGRVALCVFIGYLLPGMSAASVRTFVALAITVCVQIGSELVLIKQSSSQLDSSTKMWFTKVNIILFICVVVLGLLLGCMILASKAIHGLMRQRISAISPIIEEDESNERNMSTSWTDFEDEVFRSWFVARVCRADYVISRSAFSSAIGIVVTISVTFCVLSNTFHNEYFDEYPYLYLLDSSIIGLLFSFIVIGWIVICWRSLAAQLYFHPRRQCWRKRLCVEEFWTSNTVELIHMYDIKGAQQRFHNDERSNSKMLCLVLNKLKRLPIKIFTKFKLHKLLHLLLIFQVTVIFFTKLCALLSEVTVGFSFYWCRKLMKKKDQDASLKKYKRTLKVVCMPGEDPSDLFEANQMSYVKVKRLMVEGCKQDSLSQKIVSVFDTYSQKWAEDGTDLLNRLNKRALPSVLKYFPSVEKRCVKLTVLSLLTIFIQLQTAKSDLLMNICGAVWDLLNFVDNCDIDVEVNQIRLLDDLNKDKDQVSMAADKQFYKLQMQCAKFSSGCENARKFLQDLLKEKEKLLRQENLLENDKEEEVVVDLSDSEEEEVAVLSDSKDWVKIAPSYTLYKLCKLMLDFDNEDFVAWTEESLRNVIACSVSRVPDMLVKQCWKWAQEQVEENKLWEAIHLAGKCRGIMEKWDPTAQPTLSTRVMQSTKP